MTIKIHVQHIWPSPETDNMVGSRMKITYDAQERQMREILGPDVELRVQFNEKSSYFTNCFSLDAYNVVGILDGIADAEAQGCDVVLIPCGNDPALRQARDQLSIPIVGMTESGIHTACMLGQRFGIITMDDASVAIVERNLRDYALGARAVAHRPVRSAGFYEGATQWFEDEAYFREKVVPQFDAVARELIADGADVIVTACGNFSSFSLHGHSHVTGTKVPIVDSFVTAVHMARMMGELNQRFGLSTSKHGAYAGVSPEYRAFALASARGETPERQARAA